MSDSFVTPWTVAHQAPLSMEFPRWEYWSILVDSWRILLLIFLTQGSNLHLLHCRQILYHWATREAQEMREWHVKRARDPKPGGVKHGSSKYAPTQSAQGKEGLEERRVVHLAQRGSCNSRPGASAFWSQDRPDRRSHAKKLLCGAKWRSSAIN